MRKSTIKKKDVTKLYWENPEDFADLFNAVYFGGKEVLKAGELTQMDSDLPLLETEEGYLETTDQSRDILKLANHVWARGAYLLLAGLENQTGVHYAMPLRIMGYEYRNYRKQYEENVRRHKQERFADMSGAEVISGMCRTELLIPVVTVVLYYGVKPWDGAKSLHGMLDIPEEMQAHVADYPMHLIEMRNADLPVHTKRNRDFFRITRLLLDDKKPVKERLEQVIRDERENDVDMLVMLTVSEMFAGGRLKPRQRKEETVMLDVFEEIMDMGRKEGMDMGRKEGMQNGRIEAVLVLLSGMGSVPDELRQTIKNQTNPDKLRSWLRLAAQAESIEAFCAKM